MDADRGLGWEPDAPPVRLWTEPSFDPLGSGWILGPFDTNPVTGEQEVAPGNVIPRIWFQPAEGEPVPIDITDMALPAGDCPGEGGSISPNTVAAHVDAGCTGTGVREVWIITFDDLPA